MSDQSAALNRFGLGARPHDTVPDDPRGWLIDQCGRFNPAPPAATQQPDRGAVTGRLVAFYDTLRQERQKLKAAGELPANPGRRAAMGMAASAHPVTNVAAADMTAAAMRPVAPMMAGAPMPAAARPANPLRAATRDARKELRDLYVDGVAARLTMAATTDTPFAERLVHFWSNHFAVSVEKPEVRAFATDYEFRAIRPHVMGRFGNLLVSAVMHPAMLTFLDQAQSIGPNSDVARMIALRQARNPNRHIPGLNENLGREIMELHTLGVRSGYTQADVTEFARALTGFTVTGLGRGPLAKRLDALGAPGETVFVEALHEPGARTIMGRRYAEDGRAQAAAILTMLASHPATARHIAFKLARHFVADNPPPALVQRMAATFLATGGDLPAVYRVMIAAPEAWGPQAVKFKTPWDWTVSAMRATGVAALPRPIVSPYLLNQLGQPVWQPGSPAGFDDIAASWQSAGALMERVEVAQRFGNQLGDRYDARQVASGLLPGTLSRDTATGIARADSAAQATALFLSSPEFMRRA